MSQARDTRGRFVGTGAARKSSPSASSSPARTGNLLGVRITISGDKAIARAFKQLEPKLAKKVIRQALRKGAKVILADARAHAPVDTGAGRKKMRVLASKGPRGTKARNTIALAVLAGDALGPTWYMWLQERGYHIGHRQRVGGEVTGYTPTRGPEVIEVPGLHFMRSAMRQHEGPVKEQVVRDILAGIEREAKG